VFQNSSSTKTFIGEKKKETTRIAKEKEGKIKGK
jgi:hypothetical protein